MTVEYLLNYCIHEYNYNTYKSGKAWACLLIQADSQSFLLFLQPKSYHRDMELFSHQKLVFHQNFLNLFLR